MRQSACRGAMRRSVSLLEKVQRRSGCHTNDPRAVLERSLNGGVGSDELRNTLRDRGLTRSFLALIKRSNSFENTMHGNLSPCGMNHRVQN